MDQPDVAAQTRGEYLRLTWLLERTDDRRQRRDLHWWTQQLWWSHVEKWLGLLYGVVDHFIYERGRLCVEITQEAFCRLRPVDLANVPAWDWVTDIIVRKGGLDLLLHLGRSPRPPLLAAVDVGRGSLEEGEIEYLLEEGFWPDVPELNLHKNSLGDGGATALAYWPGLEGVSRLDLRACGVGAEGLLSLARSPYLDRMERMFLTLPTRLTESARLLNDRLGVRLGWS
jgi:hypothetical protein